MAGEHSGMLSRRAFAALASAAAFAPTAARAQSAEPPGDPRLANHPQFQAAFAHLRARRWRDLAAIARRETPDSACVLLGDLGDQSDVDLDLSGLERVPMGSTIMGALYVDWAWRYRGSGFADSVTDRMLSAFSERLLLARAQLETAIDRDANDGVAYNFLIRTLTGMSELQALGSVWDNFTTTTRRPVRAYSSMANALAAKWFGSHDTMLGFARAHQRALEPASHALVPLAYHEIIFSIMRDESVDAALAYAARPNVLNEVAAAEEAFRTAPVSQDRYLNTFAHGQFSYFFSLLGMNDLARPHMQGMGDAISGPWGLLDDPVGRVQRYRDILGLSDA